MRNTQQLRDEMKEKISTIIEEKDMFKSPGDYALQRIEQGALWTPKVDEEDTSNDEFVTKNYVDHQVTLSGEEGILISESDDMITLSADPQWEQGGNIDFIAGDPGGEINFKTDKHTVTLTEIVLLKEQIGWLQAQVDMLVGERVVQEIKEGNAQLCTFDNPGFDRARSVAAL